MLKKFFAALLAVLSTSCATTAPGWFRYDLNDDIIKSIRQGDTQASVLAKLGEPYQRVRFANLKATAFDYYYRDSWGYRAEMAIMIGDDGIVQGRVSSRVEGGRDRS